MAERKYIVTERAHLMCPNMCFGILVRLGTEYDGEKLRRVMEALEGAHPLMKSIVARDESGRLFYEWRAEINTKVMERKGKWDEDWRELTADGWDVFGEGLLRVVIYLKESGFEALFIAHHLIGDGRAVLGLACEFADCYAEGKKPAFAEERLIGSLADLPEGSGLPFLSRMVIDNANKKWQKEGGRVDFEEYREFEKRFIADNPVKLSVETTEADKVEKMRQACRKEGISLNDWLVAEMMCADGTQKVVIAADIRNRLKCYNVGALGNYATAMGIVSKSKTTDVMERAKEVSRQIKRHFADNSKLMLVLACYLRMTPELIDAVAISTMGGFESKAGRFVGSAMFGYEKRNGYSVTNLGNVNNRNIEEATFIPPASPANKKTVGVVSINGRMRKCAAEYE